MLSNIHARARRWRFILSMVVAGMTLLFPDRAIAWGERAHARIAELALETLSSQHRGQIVLYKEDLLEGATRGHSEETTQSDDPTFTPQISNDVRVLMLIPHEGADLTHYFAYRLGALGLAVADSALPFACSPAPSDMVLQAKFESDIDSDVGSFRVEKISTSSLTYPDSYAERISREARKSENHVKSRYLAGGGYDACKGDIVNPSFKRAVEAVANVWTTVLSGKPSPKAIPSPQRVNYYLSQARYSSEKAYLDDVHAALKSLKLEGRRVPLTPTFVGEKFFSLPCNAQTSMIYDLARIVDPHSATVSNSKRTCDEYVAAHPEEETEEPFQKRQLPRSLYGRSGKPPDIFVYQHNSGLIKLTSKVKDLGPDYVLLNFEPIKRIKREQVVKTVKGEPQVEIVDLDEIIRIYAREYKISPALVKAVIKAESDFDPYAVSSAGARGLMQLMPSTALEMQVDDPFDPVQNVAGGVQYLACMLELFNDDERLALAAYNAGPGNVLRYGGIPPFRETKEYVPRVLNYYDRYKTNPSPVKLKVALNKKPSAEYLPDVQVVEEVEVEVTVSSPLPASPKPSKDQVIVVLKNGNTMRGIAYEKTPKGIKLKFPNGSIIIREEMVTKIL